MAKARLKCCVITAVLDKNNVCTIMLLHACRLFLAVKKMVVYKKCLQITIVLLRITFVLVQLVFMVSGNVIMAYCYLLSNYMYFLNIVHYSVWCFFIF